MSKSITLDTKSNNPLGVMMAYCPRCKKDSGIMMVGNRKYITTCPHCNTENIGSKPTEFCGKCKKIMVGGKKKILPDHTRLPGALCKECEEELQEFQRIVSIGGVFWKCQECGQHGVIKPGKFADTVRAKGAKGVEFTYCKEHTIEEPKTNETDKSNNV